MLNCKRMETDFKRLGYDLVTGGTDSHLLLLDLRKNVRPILIQKIDGARVERILELVNIATNKNTVPGDKSALIPSGLRMGSPAMTTRGLLADDFGTVCEFIDRAVKLTVKINSQIKGQKLKDFKEAVGHDGGLFKAEIAAFKAEVAAFSKSFPVVGFDVNGMKFQ